MAFVPFNPSGGGGGGGGTVSANDVLQTSTRVFVTPDQRDILASAPVDGKLNALKDNVWTEIPIATDTATGLVKPSSQMEVDAGGNLSVKPATDTTTGAVKPSSIMEVEADGTLTVKPATETTLGAVKVGPNLTIAPDGTIDSVQVAATKIAVPDQAAMLALPEITNLYIVTRIDLNQIFYLNANTDPSVLANWEAGPSTADVVTGWQGTNDTQPQTGIVIAKKGDYNLNLVPTTDTVTAIEYTIEVRNGIAGLFDGTNFEPIGSSGLFVPLVKAGVNPTNGLTVTASDTVTVFQSRNNNVTRSFAYSPIDNRLSLQSSPLAVANSDSQVMTRFDTSRLCISKTSADIMQADVFAQATTTGLTWTMTYSGSSQTLSLNYAAGRWTQSQPPAANPSSNGHIMTYKDTEALYARRPTGAATPDVGSSSVYWGNVYMNRAYTNDIRPISGTTTFSTGVPRTGAAFDWGSASLTWNSVFLRNIQSDVSVIGLLASVSPGTDGTRTMGTSSSKWGIVFTENVQNGNGSNLYLGNQNNPQMCQMSGGGNWLSSGNPNVASLGSSSLRWNWAFLNSGVNTPSDEDLKENIVQIPDALLDVWFDYVQPLQYTLKAEPEGGIYIGVIAQDVIAAFEAAGLDWHDYHVIYENQELIAEDYTLEDAEKNDYYSVKYEAVQLIEAMAIRRKLSIKPNKRFKKPSFWRKLWFGWGK